MKRQPGEFHGVLNVGKPGNGPPYFFSRPKSAKSGSTNLAFGLKTQRRIGQIKTAARQIARTSLNSHYSPSRQALMMRRHSAMTFALESLGLLPESLACREQLDAQLTDCNLRWVEVGYGSPKSRKVFGGVVGSIDLKVMNQEAAVVLKLGTLTGIGELHRMGFGRFSVEPLLTLATAESNSVTPSWN